MSDPIIPFDLGRMLLGDAPPLYLAEIIFRTAVIYGYMFGLMRLLGRRAKSQLSILDILVILALGSAVGDGNFYPQVPILHCLLVITIIVLANKIVVITADNHLKVRELVEGKPRIVVKEGIVQTASLAQSGIGLHDLRELIRLKGACNLGQLDLVVLEPSCNVSLYYRPTPKPGLSILPDDAGDSVAMGGSVCCASCGVEQVNHHSECQDPYCRSEGLTRYTLPRYGLPEQ